MGEQAATSDPEALQSDAGSEPPALSVVLVALYKGPVYRDAHPQLWESLLDERAAVEDHVAVIGLQLQIDENEGYAFLRSRPLGETEAQIPRLMPRHSLSFHLSLLLALLRGRLAEFDATSTDTQLVLTTEQMTEMLRVFMPDSSNETRLFANVEAQINKAAELGFLRRLRGTDDTYEVRRILRAYVDGQWLADFDERLDEYLADLGGEPVAGAAGDHTESESAEERDG